MMNAEAVRRTTTALGLAAILGCAIGGTADAQQSPGKPTVSDQALLERLQPSRPADGTVALGAVVNPASYVLGPSDVLGLNVWMSPPVHHRLDVTPEGTVIVPAVGEIHVAGLALASAKERVLAAVKRRYASSDVTLTLLRPRPIVVTVRGNVLHPGQYTLTGTDRADRAIQHANAPRDPAEAQRLEEVERTMTRRHVVVSRLDGSRAKADIDRFLATGSDADNPYLREGDVIVVPRIKQLSHQFAVYGEVNAPGRYEHVEGDRLLDAVRIAQGFTDYALTDSVEVSRLSDDGRTMSSRTVRIGREPLSVTDDLPIEPGDRIVVRRRTDLRADFRVFVEGEVRHPGTYPITRDRTRISDVIALAGGFTEFASLKSAELNRRSIDPQEVETDRLMSVRGGITPEDSLDYLQETELRLRKEIVTVDFEGLFARGDSTQDVLLQNDDVIRVPAISRTIYVFGQIVTPGHIPFREGEGPAWYVAQAGGFTERARQDDLRIIKSRTKQWLAADETAVEEGDYIWVPKEPDRSFAYYMTTASQAAGVLSVIVGMAAVIISLSN